MTTTPNVHYNMVLLSAAVALGTMVTAKPVSILMSAKLVYTVVISMHIVTTTQDRSNVSANAGTRETAFKSAL